MDMGLEGYAVLTHTSVTNQELAIPCLQYNAEKHGGTILVIHQLFTLQQPNIDCTINLYGASSSLIFSGNRAGPGGSDMYGAILMGCYAMGNYVRTFNPVQHDL